MQWFRWGQQAHIFGLPISFCIILAGFYNLAEIRHFWSLMSIGNGRLVYLNMATVLSTSFNTPRLLMLGKMGIAVLWGLSSILSIALLSTSVVMGYIMFTLGCGYYFQIAWMMLYALYRKCVIGFEEDRMIFRRPPKIPWPQQFWLCYMLYIMAYVIFAILALDMHWSYIKIIQKRGTGWERKAHYEIHQAEQQTVSSLREKWDARMGLDSNQASTAPPRNFQAGERQPLIADASSIP